MTSLFEKLKTIVSEQARSCSLQMVYIVHTKKTAKSVNSNLRLVFDGIILLNIHIECTKRVLKRKFMLILPCYDTSSESVW